MNDKQLRQDLIRLAHANPELRPHLMPMIKQSGVRWLYEAKVSLPKENAKEIADLLDRALNKVLSKVKGMEGHPFISNLRP